MNKRISILSIICGIIISIFITTQASAIIANYKEEVVGQQAEAVVVVTGKVISTKYIPKDENNFYQTVNYELQVQNIERNDNRGQIKVGTIIQMSHNCDMATEMHEPSTKSECTQFAPKVGNEETVYMDYSSRACSSMPCPQYYQAVIYEDDIIDYGSTQSITNNNYLIYIVAITIIVIACASVTAFYMIKKKVKKLKSSHFHQSPFK